MRTAIYSGVEVVVAFLGPAGTYSEEAAISYFGETALRHPCQSIEQICAQVKAGECTHGVLPLENSTEGVVPRSLDLLYETGPAITGEVVLPINHNLMCVHGDLGGIDVICAHEQALGQCRQWLSQLPRKPVLKPVSSNGEAARLASVHPNHAAIASERAAHHYGLNIVARAIQDHAHNRTRFVVIGGESAPQSGHDCTSLVASVSNTAGALLTLLTPFAANALSILHLEVRPARQQGWTYRFYLDVAGHQRDGAMRKAITQASAIADELVVLGSYQRAS